jgi:glucokinase
MTVLAVDVGGTTTAAATVTRAGEVTHERQRPTHEAGAGTALATIERLLDAVRAEVGAESLDGIGVGVPAVVDFDAGVIGEEAHHVPELAGMALARILTERFALPAFVDNDVNALTLAEYRFGPDRGARSMVLLAPGTGFGCGIVLEGRVVRGTRGFGGELGHAPVKFDGRACWCGGRGCLAVYASGRGIAEAARAGAAGAEGRALLDAAGGDPGRIDTPLVFRLAREGEPVAAAIVQEACDALGAMLGVVINGLNPDVVVITGGVATSLLALEKEVLAAAARHAFARALATTRIRITPGDKRLSMRGAAALAFHELELRRTR